MVDFNTSYELLVNGSLFSAANTSYLAIWGSWFWPIIFLVTLGLVAMTSRNAAMVALATIIGNVTLWAFLPVQTSIIFYIVLVFSIALSFYMIVGSTRTD